MPVPRSTQTQQNGLTVTDGEPWKELRERDMLLLQVLQLFPMNKLRTVRYFSEVDLDPAILDCVNETQRAVQNIHVSLCDPRQLVLLPRRSVLAGFQGTHDKTYKFVDFVRALPPLESLSLLFWGGWSHDNSLYWEEEHNLDSFEGRRVITQQLAISGSMPPSFTSAVAYIFDLSALTKLTLFDCAITFFLRLSKSPNLQNLTHFQFRTVDGISTYDSLSFHKFFEQNQKLQHVTLSLGALTTVPLEPQPFVPGPLPAALATFSTEYLSSLRHRLRTLSMFDPMWVETQGPGAHTSHPFLSNPSLQYICREFENLQELGFQGPNQAFFVASGANMTHDPLMSYLNPIRSLKDLRVLHLYQNNLNYTEPSYCRGDEQVSLDIHRFATQFFEWAHSYCPRLSVLIWGIYGEPSEEVLQVTLDDAHDDGFAIERASQHLFLKRRAVLQNGLVQATAVRVSYSQLRDEFPDMDILACDPGFQTLERFNHLPCR
ncbi:hypothetical protein BKA66DRAFT_569080 [Pyrenochaeta sp. MPI-SDFR-AT-0127]|nr:hypothetical protein BKA66DRAFT_569080 [Pyrenochaeta sp. MPI-SDFR-AT-0127]